MIEQYRYVVESGSTQYSYGEYRLAIMKLLNCWMRRKEAKLWKLDYNGKKVERLGAVWKEQGRWHYYYEEEPLEED